MFSGLKRSWKELKRGRPGRRFQDRVERRRHERSSRSLIRRFVEPALGILLILIGLFLCLIPGPGVPLIILGATILSERSRPVARALDWAEMTLRKIIRQMRAWWKRAPLRQKIVVAVVGGLSLLGAGIGSYAATFGR